MRRWEGSLVAQGEFRCPVEDEDGGNSQTHLEILNGAGGEAAPLSFGERTRARPPALSSAGL